MWYSHHLPSRLPLQKRKAGVVEVHLEQACGSFAYSCLDRL